MEEYKVGDVLIAKYVGITQKKYGRLIKKDRLIFEHHITIEGKKAIIRECDFNPYKIKEDVRFCVDEGDELSVRVIGIDHSVIYATNLFITKEEEEKAFEDDALIRHALEVIRKVRGDNQ